MSDQKINIAFIGTGLMGLPMVQNLSKGNYQINAFNRTPSKMDGLKEESNIKIFDSLEQAIKNSSIVITMLPDDEEIGRASCRERV